jgi:hypothetical protein
LRLNPTVSKILDGWGKWADSIWPLTEYNQLNPIFYISIKKATLKFQLSLLRAAYLILIGRWFNNN